MGRLDVRVQPGARRTAFNGWYGDIARVAVAARAVDDAANEELVAAVARWLGVRRRQVRIVGGTRSRSKRLEIDDLDDEQISARVIALNPRPNR